MRRTGALALVALLVAWLGVACLDISSPLGDIGSISPILLPSPSVVVGDSSRDSLGAVAPVRVLVFKPNGDTLRNARVVFFALDDSGGLRIDSATGIAHGDKVSAVARVVARVSPAGGSGSIQTLAASFPVVPVPQRVDKDSDVTRFQFDLLATDSLAAGLRSSPLAVTVRGDTTVPLYLVRYELARPIQAKGNAPAILIVDDAGKSSGLDTTDASGHASRRLRIRLSAITDQLSSGATVDTAIVRVHVQYKGADLANSPLDFVVEVSVKK
jgi:hypothetical protein